MTTTRRQDRLPSTRVSTPPPAVPPPRFPPVVPPAAATPPAPVPPARPSRGAVVVRVLVVLLVLGAAATGLVAALGGPGAPARDLPAAAQVAPTGMDPELERRVAAATAAAAAEGVELSVTSGWRSAEEQQRLVDEAVERHGVPEAYRWVLPPGDSAHVQGLAVDLGPLEGWLWLGERAEAFGLCRTYVNEPWHFEPLPDGATTCPAPHPDASWAW